MRHHTVSEIRDNISEDSVTSIYRITFILKMEAADPPVYQTRQHDTREDHYPSTNCHENLTSLISALLIPDFMAVKKPGSSVAK